MKTFKPVIGMLASIATIVLMAIGSTTTALAAAPALQGQISLRPLTPSEIADYGLPAGTETSAGLTSVGKGQPIYLDALVNSAIAPSNIVSVSWFLTNKPIGSAAGFTNSPLGSNVPPYKMADRYDQSGKPVSQVAGRALLRPDLTGQYTVLLTIVTAGGSGTTNIAQNISVGTYMGIQVCAFCHSGSVLAENKYTPWSQTEHATMFSRGIDGLVSTHYSKNCLQCHTVGYDTNTNAVNGGFDDIATQLGWTFPAVLTNGNWASMQTNYSTLANLANIQCENCHGPGSEHAYSFGNTNLFNWPRLGISLGAGDCAQCHDSKPNEIKGAEWNNSLHARATRTPSGAGHEACVRCHTAAGFTAWAEAGGMTNQNAHPTTLNYTPSTAYEALTCQTCHDPHDASNPHQLRLPSNVTLSDGTVVTNAGSGGFCMECHNSRGGSYTNMLAKYPLGQNTWVGGSAFGTHDSPQADILEGVNAETYGKVIPSAAHANSISNTCAGCHMQTVATTDSAYLQAGGHTFHMTYTNSVGATLDKVDVCVQCHGPIASFDMVKADYNGDGVIEGVQTEVQHLLDKLSTLLPPRSGYQANPANYVADGLVKTSDSQMAIYTNVPTKFLKAYYNWDVVFRDGSLGIHNAPFVVGLLKASIGDLTGDANTDGLPDSWQTNYFGSATNPNAAPNACPAGDGIPNWLKYALGLNPLIPGIVVPDGVVWANGSTIGGATNTIHIYTAAEVAFDTDLGKMYQIQAVSSLGGGWQNVGAPIAGTGTTISYVTPTRSKAQQFYRVVHTP